MRYSILQSFCTSADSKSFEQTPPLLLGPLKVWSQLQRLQVVMVKGSRAVKSKQLGSGWTFSFIGGKESGGRVLSLQAKLF